MINTYQAAVVFFQTLLFLVPASNNMKPISLYGHHTRPNPKKVVMVLDELRISYEIKLLEFPEMEQPACLRSILQKATIGCLTLLSAILPAHTGG